MKCPYCDQQAEWVENKEVYGRNYGKSYMIWLCRPCDAYVGCHNNTQQAFGSMADKATRDARMKAHAAVDPIWKSGKAYKGTVYKLLSKKLGYSVHMGNASTKECEEIIKTAALLFPLSVSGEDKV